MLQYCVHGGRTNSRVRRDVRLKKQFTGGPFLMGLRSQFSETRKNSFITRNLKMRLFSVYNRTDILERKKGVDDSLSLSLNFE